MRSTTQHLLHNCKKSNHITAKSQSSVASARRSFHSSTIQRETFWGAVQVPQVKNEPVKEYGRGSVERASLLKSCDDLVHLTTEITAQIPCVINGKEIFTGDTVKREFPADRHRTLCEIHRADASLIQEAIDGALRAKREWENMAVEHRISVFLRAAELLSTAKRDLVSSATMMGQGKTMYQAEIDAACETIDFWRFNAFYAAKLAQTQPEHHATGVWNRLEYRALEGFVACISPFNFTAIASNLCSAPAQMGNVCVWKPSEASALSNYYIFKTLQEAGLPDGVIQFVPSVGPLFGDVTLNHAELAGLHFTGSTPTFNHLWGKIGNNLHKYRALPRIVGETGGKNFHYVHPSADLENVVYNTIRGAFEYQGQKCSATSRAYIPQSMWNNGLRELLLREVNKIKVGQPNDPTSFMSAVIDEKSFDNITGFIERARNNKNNTIVAGGTYSKDKGYFIDPTIILTTDPKSETMVKEIFGPVLTIYLYDDQAVNAMDDILKLIDETSPYALTGSIFAKDRLAISKASALLRNTAGNFYINDKSTGAVVGQQPFGGSRASGTNDKGGAEFMLHRWVSIRSIKENFGQLHGWGYPSVDMAPQ